MISADRFRMKDVTSANFGLLIAYVLPGFILLWGMEPFSSTIQFWFGQSNTQTSSLGGFLYVTVASVGVGQFTSTIRWMVIDAIHHRTGIRPPVWNFSKLTKNVAAFDQLIEIHYRYYQWHANTFVALNFAVLLRAMVYGISATQFGILMAVDAVLFVGSRDTLRKYYHRVNELL